MNVAVPRFAQKRVLRFLLPEEGSNLLEYAIILMVLLTLLFGIAGFGHALYAYHFVSTAAREAARWAAVNGSTCAGDGSCAAPASLGDIQTYVSDRIPLGIDSQQLTVTPSWNPAGSNGPPSCATTANAPGCTVKVQVNYNFQFIFPLIRTATLPLSSASEMIIAH